MAKKNKTFALEYQTWLSNKWVRLMTKEQRSIYMDLLCHLAEEGKNGIEDNDKDLCKLLDCSVEDLHVVKQRLSAKEGYLFSKKLSDLMDKPPKKAKASGNLFDVPKDLTVDEQIKWKKAKVVDDLRQFKDNYSRELLNQFYLYWTEPTADKKQIRMEMQDTWDYERRLNTWSRNDNRHGGKGGASVNPLNPNGTPPTKTEKLINANAGAKEMIKNINADKK